MVIVTASYPPKDFIFKALSNLLGLCLPDKSLYFWQVIESIQKFIIEIHALQCLFVRSSIKNHRRGKIISNFTKGETFDLLWQPSALGGDLTMCPVFLYSPRKALLSPSLWPRKEHTWTLNWKGSLLICFENRVGVPYSIRQSRNSMMNSFITVNITTHVRGSLEDTFILAHSKKTFLPSVWPGAEYVGRIIWKRSLLICFESFSEFRISYSPTQRDDGEHFAYM